ncbi:hypothetical protein [Dactylosporangium salmoneum]
MNLHVFLSRLHTDHHAGRLTEAQIAAAEAIGVRWTTVSAGPDPKDPM